MRRRESASGDPGEAPLDKARPARQQRAANPKRWSPIERELRATIGPLLAGVDEVGRGPIAGPVVAGADVVVDCSDSFETRYLVNDACCEERVPLVEAAVLGFEGLVMSIRPGESACYRCAFPTPPPAGAVPSCREAGVVGAMAGIVGSIQALEAIKLLTGIGEPLLDRFLRIDGTGMEQTVVHTRRRDACSACARVPAAAQSR